MANPLQKAAVTRKITYLVAIAALFTVSLFVRGKVPVPVPALNRGTIYSQAERLDLRELDLGDAELAGSAMRLGLTGMRGVVTTILWRTAIEKQKRNEFQEMEDIVRIVSRLQPHFITPWIFQGWNMSYNVSVENSRLNDMYFYIARGLEFMAEGERLNTKIVDKGLPTEHRIGSPDLRYQIGFFYQNKFTVSDKVTTLRSLFQLSNIPPNERKPGIFYLGNDKTVQTGEGSQFRKFCRDYPQFVRRLRDKLDCRKPEEVVQFLKDNEKVPTRFQLNSELADPSEQFPILPDKFNEQPDEYNPLMKIPGDTFDGVQAGRAWFEYAQTTLPPNPTFPDGRPIPSGILELRPEDVFKYRIPRAPALIVFRQSPCRAQSYVADRLMKAGWFDKDTTWRPDEMRDANSFWFKTSAVEPDLEFRSTDNAQDQWQKAYRMWNAHGRATGMILSFDDRLALEEKARVVPPRDDFSVMPIDELVYRFKYPRDAAIARKALLNFDKNRYMTNFEYFLEQARAESSADAVAANKMLWEAKRYDDFSNIEEAADRYARGLAMMRKVFETYEKFHRTDQSEETESDYYEVFLKFSGLVLKERNRRDSHTKAQVETAAEALIGGVSATARNDLDRMAEPAPQWAMTAAFGGPFAAAAARQDLPQGLAEREALMRIVAYEPQTQATARDVTQFGVSALVSGMVRGVEELDTPALAERKLATVALGSHLFDGRYDYRMEYEQKPTSVGTSDFLRWSRQSVEDEVKGRLGLLRKLPPPLPDDAAPVPPSGR
ncbi:MAG TPA: hypothetical protein VGJ05_21950 [Fimbriiglobus sp.]|jgi:hypothetical protein